MSLFPLSPARGVPGGGSLLAPSNFGFFSFLGGRWPPPPPVTLCHWEPLWSPTEGSPPVAGGTPPAPYPSAASPKAASPERGTPIPALMCPSQPFPSPSPQLGGGGGHCGPPIAWGCPDPRGVGLVPGCPPALRVWGLSGRVFLGRLSSARPFLTSQYGQCLISF